MKRTYTSLKVFTLSAIFCGALLFSSCSNKPSDEELRQLVKLREEVAQLQLEIETKQKDKEDLEKMIRDKKAKLQSILDEQKAAESK